MNTIIQLIGRYRDRDKFIRLCQYLLKFLAGSGQTRLSGRMLKLAEEFGNCRAVLRLFDDIPMLAFTLHYGFGKKESNTWMRVLNIINNVANQLYYPLEHIAWFGRKQIIEVQPTLWGLGCIVAWGVALLCEILKVISRIVMIRNAQKKLLKEQKLEAKNESVPSEMSNDIRKQISLLKAQERENYLTLIENSTDFINAVNFLPPGFFLWSGKFSSKFTGAMGTMSSLIKMYKIHSSAEQ